MANWINYQHFFYFYYVVKCGNVSRAAKRLKLAQSTVSAQIQTLEDHLGVELFERQGKRLALTVQGQTAYDYAHHIFSLGEEYLDAVNSGRDVSVHARVLHVGTVGVISRTMVFKMLGPIVSEIARRILQRQN